METQTKIDFTDTEGAYKHKSIADLRLSLFMFGFLNTPVIGRIGQSLLKFFVEAGLPVKPIIKATLYKQFVGGETLEDCVPIVGKLGKHHVESILDYSVEGEETEKDNEDAIKELLRNINFSATNKDIPFSVFKPTAFASTPLLEKVSKKEALNETEMAAWQKVRERFELLCSTAYEKKIYLMVDAEETWIQDAIDSLATEMMEKFNREEAYIINTIQFYRKDKLEYLHKQYDIAKEKGYKLGVKIVRGAYMEKERARAAEKNYPSPIQDSKANSDLDYNTGLLFCIDHLEDILVVAGTHNQESSMLAAKALADKNIPTNHPHFWFSQLYGMCDHISFNLAAQGYNVVKYIPYGPVKSVTPYLIRRAAENSSVEGQAQLEIALLKNELKRRKGN